MRRHVCAVLVALLLLVSLAAADTTIYSPNKSWTIGNRYFAVHGWGFATNNTPWPAGVGSYRTWDAGAVWATVEPSRGYYTWGRLDQIVNFMHGKNVDVLFTFGRVPQWASSKSTLSICGYGPGQCAPPYSMTDWSNFVSAVANRYKGRIRYYELWNEPNASNWWSGTTSQMLQMAKIAYGIIKKVDPGATVLTPAPQGLYAFQWMEGYFAIGGANYADAVAFHGYVGAVNGVTTRPPESWIPIVNNMRTAMSNYHVYKPLWDTEAGWGADWQYPSTYNRVGFVARMYMLHWLYGVSRYFWYNWDSQTYGTMWSGYNTAPGVAYYWVTKWLTGALFDRCIDYSNGTWACHLSRSGGYQAWVLWNQYGSSSYQLSSAYNLRQERNLSGGKLAISPSAKISIGTQPVLVETWSVF